MANAWLAHLKSVWSRVKGTMSYKEAMVEAKKTYNGSASAAPKTKKTKKGGNHCAMNKMGGRRGGTKKGGRR